MNRRKKVKRLGAKTISFPKGKGHLTHNNREFISNNVVPERTVWNRIYIQESLEQAYEKSLFGMSAILLSISYGVIGSIPRALFVTTLWIWAVAFLVSGLLFVIQIKKLFSKMEKGEVLCTN